MPQGLKGHMVQAAGLQNPFLVWVPIKAGSFLCPSRSVFSMVEFVVSKTQKAYQELCFLLSDVKCKIQKCVVYFGEDIPTYSNH